MIKLTEKKRMKILVYSILIVGYIFNLSVLAFVFKFYELGGEFNFKILCIFFTLFYILITMPFLPEDFTA